MKEAYAVRRTVPPSAEIQAEIDKLLSKGMVDDPQKLLSELGRLGARLIIQRAVEDEFDTWLDRARYERRAQSLPGKRNGFRSRHVQTGEGELRIEIPQVREAAIPFVSKLFSKWHCKRLLRTDPLKALVIGAFVRGLSMRDIESLCEEAGLGKTSRSTVARICAELHERFQAFSRRSLYDVNLKSEHDRVRFNYWSALTDATSVKDGKLRLEVLISELEHRGYEAAARCLAEDLDALIVHLRYPLRHRERWRSTNLLERSLGEVRRRTKVMGRFPGETSCLSLVWAVLDLFFSHASNGATFTDVDRQHLSRIKYRQADPDNLDEEVTAA